MNSSGEVPFWRDQEEIVITGISGRFPRCENVQEFGDLLLAGEDLVTEDSLRWPPGILVIITLISSYLECFSNMDRCKCLKLVNFCITEVIWHCKAVFFSGVFDLPKRHGKLKDLKKFDAQYFGITPKQVRGLACLTEKELIQFTV